MIKKIKATKALYIKLGSQDVWSDECIKNKRIKIGFNKIPHNICLQKKWKHVRTIFIKNKETEKVATRHTNELKLFYNSSNKVLWIIFHNDKLWWCFSDKKVYEDKNGRFRKVKTAWKNTNIKGDVLDLSLISSRLKKTQSYQGTICNINQLKYLLSILNGEGTVQKNQFNILYKYIKRKLKYFVQDLDPKDFELLVDLIFRNLGYQRISVLGKNEKFHDLIIKLPLSNQKITVQIKSSASLNTFKSYYKKFIELKSYSKLYFFVHTPDRGLTNYFKNKVVKKVRLFFVEEIVDMVIKAGLIDWLLERSN